MLGNAQQTMVELVTLTMPGKKGYAAMVAMGAAECYRKAVSECEDGGVRGGAVDMVVGECSRELRTYFEVLALSLQGRMYHDSNDVATEITQLDIAGQAAERGVRAVAGIKDEGLFGWIGKRKEEVKRRMENLVKELRKRKEQAEGHNR